jgi:hypothetical protein
MDFLIPSLQFSGQPRLYSSFFFSVLIRIFWIAIERAIHLLNCFSFAVDESDDTFYEMVEKANDSNKTVHQLKAPEFGAAKTESMKKFLRRIKMIVETRSFYDRLVKRRFVGILGAEDVGKSTFIKVNDLLPVLIRLSTYHPKILTLLFCSISW